MTTDGLTSSRGTVFVFQYGSNMSMDRFAANVARHAFRYAPRVTPEVRFVGRGRLRGWRFVLDLYSAQQDSRVADIAQGDARDEVWGAIYELDRELVIRSDGGRSVLDRIEGHRTERDPENYEPVAVSVDTDGGRCDAYTYVGTVDARERCRTNHCQVCVAAPYAAAVLDGARSLDVPASYLRHLEELIAAATA